MHEPKHFLPFRAIPALVKKRAIKARKHAHVLARNRPPDVRHRGRLAHHSGAHLGLHRRGDGGAVLLPARQQLRAHVLHRLHRARQCHHRAGAHDYLLGTGGQGGLEHGGGDRRHAPKGTHRRHGDNGREHGLLSVGATPIGRPHHDPPLGVAGSLHQHRRRLLVHCHNGYHLQCGVRAGRALVLCALQRDDDVRESGGVLLHTHKHFLLSGLLRQRGQHRTGAGQHQRRGVQRHHDIGVGLSHRFDIDVKNKWCSIIYPQH